MRKVLAITDNEDKPLEDRYIVIDVLPLEDRIKFTGVYKQKSKAPVNLIIEYRNIDIINRDLLEVLYIVAKGLNEKIITYSEVVETLKFINRIELPEED